MQMIRHEHKATQLCPYLRPTLAELHYRPQH
jgi:hypothetical protein